MNENRRETDRKLCKRLWEIGTPWIQIIGFAIVCTFWGTTYFAQTQAQAKVIDAYAVTLSAHEKALADLQTHYSVINQKLDDIRSFLMGPSGGH